MKIVHQKTGFVLGENIRPAISYWQRLKGYMFFKKPPQNFDGIYFPRSNWIHNSFVRFSLDVIFIDKNNIIIKIIRNFRPWSISTIYFKAAHTIEFPTGRVPGNISVGDSLVIEKI